MGDDKIHSNDEQFDFCYTLTDSGTCNEDFTSTTSLSDAEELILQQLMADNETEQTEDEINDTNSLLSEEEESILTQLIANNDNKDEEIEETNSLSEEEESILTQLIANNDNKDE